ncbi:uncharacterized protein LOC124196447 [Daphnia pulex]|uniref:uncharacterized protein LOC124196447 n=1 Tax=Daphnia pulex TaxID=6669 RepID=UPI001EDD0314|nr:uncharacterized protein LOC124196447 [Daphnia pulex]
MDNETSQKEFKKEVAPPVNVQQTVVQDQIQNLLIKVQEEVNRAESCKPWYKKKWGILTDWIDTPPTRNPPPLPPDFWVGLLAPPEERNGTNTTDDERPEEIANEFYGDHWAIVTFLSLFFFLADLSNECVL